jgi:hypothetical protein
MKALRRGSGQAGGPLVLVVLDGWGLRDEREGNAIKLARTIRDLGCDACHAFTTNPKSLVPNRCLFDFFFLRLFV